MARLEPGDRLPEVDGDAGWFVLAPPPDVAQLGELLALLRAGGHEVRGFIDRATLLAAAAGLPSQLVVPDLARQQFSISVASVDGEMAALRRQVRLPAGAHALRNAWLDLAATTLVQQTRFDPLHDQHHEAALRAALPGLAAAAQRDGQGSIEVDTGRGNVTLTLARDQLATAAQPVLRPLVAALQALSAASDDSALLVADSLLDVPGMDAALAGARFAHAYRHADGLIARAALELPRGEAPPDGPVPWLTRLPRFVSPLPDALSPLSLEGDAPRSPATHVVYRGKVMPIPATGLVVGRDADAALRLPEGIAGLSRRHCTLRRDGMRAQVVDHSSHGTWLDGARVRGRAMLAAGSTLKVGDPGVELQLVALE